MSETTLPSSIGIYVCRLWRKLNGLGEYAGEQFALELAAKSTVAIPLLETYAKLDPEITNAYGVIAPRIWLLKD
jgi:hypothetical protein